MKNYRVKISQEDVYEPFIVKIKAQNPQIAVMKIFKTYLDEDIEEVYEDLFNKPYNESEITLEEVKQICDYSEGFWWLEDSFKNRILTSYDDLEVNFGEFPQ